jgi:hypothetical protein
MRIGNNDPHIQCSTFRTDRSDSVRWLNCRSELPTTRPTKKAEAGLALLPRITCSVMTIDPALVWGRELQLFLFRFFVDGVVISAELLLEFLDATHRIHVLLLPCIKRMRGAGNVYEVNWILISIFPLNRFLCRDCRLGKDGKVSRFVFEDNRAIIGVNIGFHSSTFWVDW